MKKKRCCLAPNQDMFMYAYFIHFAISDFRLPKTTIPSFGNLKSIDLLNPTKDEKLAHSQFSPFDETISPSQQKLPGVESISPSSSNDMESPKCDLDTLSEPNFKHEFSSVQQLVRNVSIF